MSFLNPVPHRRSRAVGPFRQDRCAACFGPWPCAVERDRRALADKVPAWTEEDVTNLRARVRR